MTTFISYIVFIVCHGGPAAHFSEFAKELAKEGCRVEILATGPALDKLKGAGAKEFNPDQLDIEDPASQKILAERMAKSLGPASVVITDVGHLLMASVQEAIAHESPTIKRLAYYDNPEPLVPGDYMKTAAKVMAGANKVLFANANLATEPLYSSPFSPLLLSLEKRVGIGYYPVEAAKCLESARNSGKKSPGGGSSINTRSPIRDRKSWSIWAATTKFISNRPFPPFSCSSENLGSIHPKPSFSCSTIRVTKKRDRCEALRRLSDLHFRNNFGRGFDPCRCSPLLPNKHGTAMRPGGHPGDPGRP